MKSSLRKLRGFGFHNNNNNNNNKRTVDSLRPPVVPLHELAQATRDMQDMKDCYEKLLSAASATANCAYEFSESLGDLGACLLEKTAVNDDEESSRVLIMLGKVQFELQKVVDRYRSHLRQTISAPSESLLDELQIVEEMKQQCDEKRDIYESTLMIHQQNRKSRGAKENVFSVQQLQEAYSEYDDEATLFLFRLKSLKQGQSRSLLTQATRHHAAQFRFFKKALESLEAVEPHVKSATEEHHIDYHFCGLDDTDEDGDDDDGDTGYYDNDSNYNVHGDEELSFDYGQTDLDGDAVSPMQNLMELDGEGIAFPQVATLEAAKENLYKRPKYSGGTKTGTHSAPLFVERMQEPAEKIRPLRQMSSRKFQAYALPTPIHKKASAPVPPSNSALLRQASLRWRNYNLSHSSPLGPKRVSKISENEKSSRLTAGNLHRVLKESNSNTSGPRPEKGLLRPSDPKKFVRQAFSGPITTQKSDKTPPILFSGPILQNPVLQPLSLYPKDFKSASPAFVSRPKISELHELPRPPSNLTPKAKSARPPGLVGHSAPLGPRSKELSTAIRTSVPSEASPLPTPPQIIGRSFSISSSSPKTSNFLGASASTEITNGAASQFQTTTLWSKEKEISTSTSTGSPDSMFIGK